MLVVGLTGGIGCGKSLVSDLFHSLFSIPIIDADTISKQLSQTKQVINTIALELGSEYINNENQLNRKKLRESVFSDNAIKKKLENILHPLVYREIKTQLDELHCDYCLVSIPLLLENNRTDFIDRILVIDCKVEEQIARVMKRDQCERENVENIIATQVNRSVRLALADDVIENSGTMEAVKEKVVQLHQRYHKLSRA